MAYTTIDDPSAHFHTQLWTGNGSNPRNITNDANAGDFKPDLFWGKRRDDSGGHNIFDSSRGATKRLEAHNWDAEADDNALTAFLTDGWTINTTGLNTNTATYVAWQWKANGGTRTTNSESGNNPGGGYQANTTAGFSIVDYVGTGATGTKAHGLGATPEFIIYRNRSDWSWAIYHHSLGNAYGLYLDSTSGQVSTTTWWNSTSPTSTNLSLHTNGGVNQDAGNIIAYCFRGIQGYSKFGYYTGNGNADGPFVYLGFKPKYFLLKNATATAGSGGQHWQISDTTRHPNNPVDITLLAEDAGGDGSPWSIKDFVSNGVKIRGSNYAMNQDGDKYIYVAFAEHPFVSSEGVPCTADGYTG